MRWDKIVALVVPAVTALATAPPVFAARGQGAASAVHLQTRAEAADATAYWTADRLAAATPLDEQPGMTGPADGLDGLPGTAGLGGGAERGGDHSGVGGVAGMGAERAAGGGWARHFRGVPSVGALFFSNGRGDHYCTGSVVVSPHADLVLTAAHCLYADARRYAARVVFVPRYAAGRRPYGVWPIRSIMVDRRWAARLDPDLDFAFATVRPRHGRWIGRVVRGNRLGTDRGFRNWVHVIGYPDRPANGRDLAVRCAGRTSRAARYQVRFVCGGFTSGTSGSPWLAHYDPRTGTGTVIGVIGGLHRGGWRAAVSYTPYFDHDIRRLYLRAAGRTGDR
jgi:V8-like Glu-specific endopeptidase